MAHHNTWESISVGPVDTPDGTVYMYSVDGHLSLHTYHNDVSAWHDARKPQAYAPGLPDGVIRIVPDESSEASTAPGRSNDGEHTSGLQPGGTYDRTTTALRLAGLASRPGRRDSIALPARFRADQRRYP